MSDSFATPWTVACHALLSRGFPRQEYSQAGVGCHFLLQGIFHAQGSNLCFLHWQADYVPLSHQGSPERGKPRTELQTEGRVNTTTDQSRLHGEKSKKQRPLRMCVLSHFSGVRLFVTPWTIAHQALLSMGFSRQKYWVSVPSSRGSS